MKKRRFYPLVFFRGLPERLLESLLSVTSEACDFAHISTAFAWVVPLAIYPDFLNTTVYLHAISTKAPRVPFLCCAMVLLVYQTCALLMPRPLKSDEGGQRTSMESLTRSRQKLRWMNFRRWGHTAGVFAWGFMTWTSTTIRWTPGTAWFLATFLACLWGCIRLEIECVEETKVLAKLEARAEGFEALRSAGVNKADLLTAQ